MNIIGVTLRLPEIPIPTSQPIKASSNSSSLTKFRSTLHIKNVGVVSSAIKLAGMVVMILAVANSDKNDTIMPSVSYGFFNVKLLQILWAINLPSPVRWKNMFTGIDYGPNWGFL